MHLLRVGTRNGTPAYLKPGEKRAHGRPECCVREWAQGVEKFLNNRLRMTGFALPAMPLIPAEGDDAPETGFYKHGMELEIRATYADTLARC